MAKMEIRGDKLMKSIMLVVDTRKVERECFGLMKWRLHAAKLLVFLAAKILRTGVEWDTTVK